MKTTLKTICVMLFIALGTICYQPQAKAQGAVSIQVFYNELSPYGQWISYGGYGYVWVPTTAGPDFYPYGSQGYWANTEYGWTWVSNYSWGWAPFHYGRWIFEMPYGWMWVPDLVWGPAWVAWYSVPGYYGWAPMEPGRDIYWYHRHPHHFRYDRCTYVSYEHFGQPDMYNHYYVRRENNHIVNRAVVVKNVYTDHGRSASYNYGPPAAEVQRSTGRTVNTLAVNESSSPGQRVENNRIHMYRPVVERKAEGNQTPAPPKVVDKKEVTPVNKRVEVDQRTITPYHREPEKNQEQPRQEQPKNLPRNEQQQPKNEQPGKEQPRQDQVQPRNEQQPRRDQVEPRQEQPRNEQPKNEQPKNEQPLPRNDQPRRDQVQPRQDQPKYQPRQEQPRQEQPRNQPQPRQEQPRQQPRQEQPKQQPRQEPKPMPRQEQPRNQPQPRQEQPKNQPQPQPQGRRRSVQGNGQGQPQNINKPKANNNNDRKGDHR